MPSHTSRTQEMRYRFIYCWLCIYILYYTITIRPANNRYLCMYINKLSIYTSIDCQRMCMCIYIHLYIYDGCKTSCTNKFANSHSNPMKFAVFCTYLHSFPQVIRISPPSTIHGGVLKCSYTTQDPNPHFLGDFSIKKTCK